VTLDDLAAWLRGSDALDADADGDRTEPRHALGDPGLEPPPVLRYAGEPGRSLLFVSTADGLVHALDGETGSERWSFLPAAGGAVLRALADPAETRVRLGRAGALRLSRLDLDGDGAIDAAAGERASLLLALGAGARGYVALDVSEPDRPRLAWSIGGDALPGLGETLAPPLAARMLIDAARQRGDARVAVLTGGYDPLQRLRGAAMDGVAGRLAIVAVASGDILWQATAAAGPGVSLVEPGLAASFAAGPRAVDADGDGLAERLYALDVAGRLWRFDFAGGGATASLVARLGTAAGPGDAAAVRRFHAVPDVVYLRDGPAARLALAFGSGWAERPRDAAVDDRFYVVFDTLGGAAPSTPLGEDDLVDVTGGEPAPAGAPGWLYRLDAHGAGEKTWGRSVTLGRRLFFTTWQPLPPSADAPCGPPRGVARLYTLAIATGLPLEFVDDAPRPSVELPGEAPPPPLRLALPIRDGEPCADCDTGIRLLIGDRAVPTSVGGGPVKTSWRRLESAE
jgi:type IV pilus assembly protein PilY1